MTKAAQFREAMANVDHPRADLAMASAKVASRMLREGDVIVHENDDSCSEARFITQLRARRIGRPVHLTENGRTTVCGLHLDEGHGHFHARKIPTLENVCAGCIRGIVGTGR